MSFLPESDRDYLEEKQIKFREASDGKHNCVIIEQWSLPENKFNHAECEMLVILPNGYPDTPPDMFYVLPQLLLEGGKLAKATNAKLTFEDKTWQRWSRHFKKDEWRPGIDGLHSYFQRIKKALREAAP